jgi:tetratricopeptide (TPR) repeat protein
MDSQYNAIADLFGSLSVNLSDQTLPEKLGHTAEESDLLGRMSLEAGRYTEAIEHFKNAVNQRDPKDPSSRIELGAAYETTDQLPQAYRQYKKAIELNENAGEARVGIAELLKRYGRYKESLEELQIAIEKDPTNPYFYYKLAEILREAGAPRQALQNAMNAVVIKPDDAFLHFFVGELLLQLGQFDDALQSYRAAVELSPGDDYYYLRCAVPFWKLGMKTEAIKAVRLASDLNPEKHIYHGLLEELLRANDQEEEADLEIERAKQMDRYDDDTLDKLLSEMGV